MLKIYNKNICKKLSIGYCSSGGRNNVGNVTVNGRGGGLYKRYKYIDFKRNFINVKCIIKSIEYDSNRNSFIGLVLYSNKMFSYVILTKGAKVGDTLESFGEKMDLYSHKHGNSVLLKNCYKGECVHSIEFKPGSGGKLCRSAGSSSLILNVTNNFCYLKLPSGELRLFLNSCRCTLGVVSNELFNRIDYLKAGDVRRIGRRPKVRGVAKNPVDHPHGGGEGKTSGGRPSVNVKGFYTKGSKTKVFDNFLIIKKKKDFNTSAGYVLYKFLKKYDK